MVDTSLRGAVEGVLEHADNIQPPTDLGDPSEDYYGQIPAGKWRDRSLPPPVAEPPKAPAAGSAEATQLAVNTDALAVFRQNLGALREMIATSRGYVEQVDVKPGAFYSGFRVRDQVNGKEENPGLKWDTVSFMDNSVQALVDLEHDLGKLIIDYDTAEELNGLSVERLNSIMSESFADIDRSSEFGNDRNARGVDGDDSGGDSGGDSAA